MDPDKRSIIGTCRNILAVYLLLYFLFISNYFSFSFPVIKFLVVPLQYVSGLLIHLINALFLHQQFDGNITMDDNYWLYIAVTTYFFLAVLGVLIWNLSGGGRQTPKFFSWLTVYARFYLAFMLLAYGFSKIFGNQFSIPWPNDLIKPLGQFNVHSLLWAFMGASRSYNFFGGLLEVLAAALLLFRRTSVPGAVASIAVLLNVLMLNIGYDVQVKTMTLHLILIAVFILYPDIDRLFKFFFCNTVIEKKPDMLPTNRNLNRVWVILKFVLISYVVFVYVKYNIQSKRRQNDMLKSPLTGIYEIKVFQRKNDKGGITERNATWTKMAVMKEYATIQFGNDSSSLFIASVDTTMKTLDLKNPNDSLFKSKLSFINYKDRYEFNGVFGNDSMYIDARKIDPESLPLIKDRGKIQWLWY